MNMPAPSSGTLILIRHAPVTVPGRLFGRHDVAARIEDAAIEQARARIGDIAHVVSSPALRCRQTAVALFGKPEPALDPRLWEQDFGTHENLAFADLPDLGVLDAARLAAYAAPGGESFRDLCYRIAPALQNHAELACRAGPVALVVHAGVIRASLAQVVGHIPAGLAFEVGNLSVTRLRCDATGPLSVIGVNAL